MRDAPTESPHRRGVHPGRRLRRLPSRCRPPPADVRSRRRSTGAAERPDPGDPDATGIRTRHREPRDPAGLLVRRRSRECRPARSSPPTSTRGTRTSRGPPTIFLIPAGATDADGGPRRVRDGRSDARARTASSHPEDYYVNVHTASVPGRSRPGSARLTSLAGVRRPGTGRRPCLYPWCRGCRAARHVRHASRGRAGTSSPTRIAGELGRRPGGPLPRLRPHQGRPERRRVRRAGGRHGRDRRGRRLRVHTPVDRDAPGRTRAGVLGDRHRALGGLDPGGPRAPSAWREDGARQQLLPLDAPDRRPPRTRRGVRRDHPVVRGGSAEARPRDLPGGAPPARMSSRIAPCSSTTSRSTATAPPRSGSRPT